MSTAASCSICSSLSEKGASTLVTRSIGDWDASRACIPQPEIVRFTLEEGSLARVVLASDGLWDFATHAQAAGLLHKARTAEAGARSLLRHAVQASNVRYNDLKDDTTVVVVELDCRAPGDRALAKVGGSGEAAGCGACLIQ